MIPTCAMRRFQSTRSEPGSATTTRKRNYGKQSQDPGQNGSVCGAIVNNKATWRFPSSSLLSRLAIHAHVQANVHTKGTFPVFIFISIRLGRRGGLCCWSPFFKFAFRLSLHPARPSIITHISRQRASCIAHKSHLPQHVLQPHLPLLRAAQ